jgi:hypothetical protein
MGSIQLRQTARSLIWMALFLLGCCGIFSGRMALAQVDQGAINGVVKDSTGAVVPHAVVTLTNTDTNFVLQGKSDGKGEYSFSPIKIGNYTVSATAPGFETTTQENVRVNIQDRLSIDIALKPGGVKETVTVTGAPPMLQSETASVGQVMSTDTINATPLNGRNWIYIAQLAAGVDPSFANGTARGGGTGDFSANGQRTTQNNFILDGVDNNVNVDDFQIGASYNVRPPPDALAEFKIDTSNYSAEFGHSAGAVLSASIKSGTNKIHGDIWEYVRNTRFDAQDWDSNAGVPAYHENQFGATLGLPLWRNKIFYFGDAEANRIAFAQPSTTLTVPTASMRNGDFSELFNCIPGASCSSTHNAQTNKTVPIGIFAPNTGGQLPETQTGGAFPNPGDGQQSDTAVNGQPTTNVLTPGTPTPGGPGQMDPVAAELMAAYPKPNAGGWNSTNYSTPGSGLVYNNYNVNLPVEDDTFQWDQRLDWNISAKDQTYARYSYTHEQIRFTPPLGPVLDGGNDVSSFHGATNFNLAQNFMASETHLFAPSLINEFRFGYNEGKYEFVQSNANVPASTLIPGMGGVPFSGYPEANGGLPYIPLTGTISMSAIGARRDVPSVEHQNVYQILDNVTKVWKNHSLKFGMQLESIRTSFSQSTYPRGRDTFNGEFSGNYNYTDVPGAPDYNPNGNPGSHVPNTGMGAADLFGNNMGNVGLSPGWNTSYYRWYRSAYAQDDWKFNSRLTVNLGVRYDFTQPESSKPGDLANLVITSTSLTAPGAGTNSQSATGTAIYELPANLSSQNLLPPQFVSLLASQGASIEYSSNNPNSLVTVQHDNFAPRIGFAYQPDPKTVIRSGYGIFFGSLEAPGGAELEQNYPFSYAAVLYNAYLGSGACFPSAQGGPFNTASQCPSAATADTANGSNLPYPATLETGMSLYLNNGGLTTAAVGQTAFSGSDTHPKTTYTQSYNLTLERELSRNMVASIAYVGNSAKHTFAGTNPLGPIAVSSSNDPLGDQGTSPLPDLYYNNADEQWIGEAMYNGLQTKLEKRASAGLSFLATYTWSHAEDDASNPGIGGGPSYRNTNVIPLKYEFTNANYDARHRVTLNGTYDLPFGRGRKYLASGGGLLDYLVGGWSASAKWSAQTGNPFTVASGGNFSSAVGFNQINAIRVGDPFKGGGTPLAANANMVGETCPSSVKNKTNWYNPCAFIDPTPGGNIPVGVFLTDVQSAIAYSGAKSNQIYAPGYERVDMSAFKNFKTWREQYVQFRADAFNLFNTQSWNSPSDNSDSPTGGQITSAQQFQNYTPDARFFQLAAKYVF